VTPDEAFPPKKASGAPRMIAAQITAWQYVPQQSLNVIGRQGRGFASGAVSG
jgi:hypothetical protein